MVDGSLQSVNVTKLKTLGRFLQVDLAGSQDVLQRRKEQFCISTDNQGIDRKFALHLTLGISKKYMHLGTEICEAFPFLMYLHGTGGGSFTECFL